MQASENTSKFTHLIFSLSGALQWLLEGKLTPEDLDHAIFFLDHENVTSADAYLKSVDIQEAPNSLALRMQVRTLIAALEKAAIENRLTWDVKEFSYVCGLTVARLLQAVLSYHHIKQPRSFMVHMGSLPKEFIYQEFERALNAASVPLIVVY